MDGRHFKFFETYATLNWRQNNQTTHTINTSYSDRTISKSVLEINPNYFNDQSNQQQYFGLRYQFTFDNRDKRFLANSGMRAEFLLNKTGLGFYDDVDYMYAQIGLQKMFPLNSTKSIFIRWQPKIKYFLSNSKVPYNHQKALGYRHNLVRGFEDNIVDGLNFYLSRNSIIFQFFERNINLKNAGFLKRFEQLPIGMYFGLHYDVGYVENELGIESTLTNNWLRGYGASVDFLVQENFHLAFEYSFTHTNLSSFNLHTQFKL